MSYILDALKKSEREKTLGQVPTLESVVSDGAKKQRSGTPWWLNIIVFIVALLVVLGLLKMAGMLNFTQPASVSTQESGQAAESTTEFNQSQSATEPVTAVSSTQTSTEQTSSQSANQSGEDISQGHSEQSLAAAQQTQAAQVEASQSQTVSEPQSEETRAPADELEVQSQLPEDLIVTEAGQTEAGQTDEQTALTRELEEKFAAQEAEELAALARQQQTQVEQQNQPESAPSSNAAAQPAPSAYEEVIHDGLRNISVNVVSYSSDPRQRFVMLDLTIYKEGDQLTNNAQVVEIIRTGAIVDYQGKRYLLKP